MEELVELIIGLLHGVALIIFVVAVLWFIEGVLL
jgi:hypothetical protein